MPLRTRAALIPPIPIATISNGRHPPGGATSPCTAAIEGREVVLVMTYLYRRTTRAAREACHTWGTRSGSGCW